MRLDAHARHVAFCALLLACVGGLAYALPPELEKPLSDFPREQREELLQREATLGAMTPMQRTAFQRRLAVWDALSERERRTRRERWQAWQTLPEEQRQRVRAAARALAALPVEAQLRLREDFAALPQDQRHGWLLGPTLGADYAHLAPLIGQVPHQQRASLLAVLRAMSPQQRVDLGVLARRIPPQQRDTLRTELLATTPANRSSWLYSWLDR